MLFNSLHFIVFFPAVFALTALLRRIVWARNLFLLVASYYFYACWDWRFLGLILISTLVDYLCGLGFDVTEVGEPPLPERARRRRLLLVTSLVTNLGILGFFKYFDFFVTSAAEFLGALGLGAHPRTLGIILPVGISFYTFQTLSYTIDLYRGRITTERNLLNFALFVAFFPQLVAGPIERASHLLPQMSSVRPMNWNRFYSGFYLMSWGLFKKVVLADNVAIAVDQVFATRDPGAIAVVAGVYGFAVQIYCDFSGYTDIARGTARILGFDLMLNFNLPYFATNPSDFWRRWHISLSTWLRDYLYIPLGGNRKGSRLTYVNLMTTMVLGGLWHGAAWTYVAWGVYHGSLLCIHRLLRPILAAWIDPNGRTSEFLWWLLRVSIFFQFTCVGWLIFRAESMSQVFQLLRALVGDFGLHGSGLSFNAGLTVLTCSIVLAIVQTVQYARRDLDVVLRAPVLVRTMVYSLAMLGFVFFGNFIGEAFIYFQF